MDISNACKALDRDVAVARARFLGAVQAPTRLDPERMGTTAPVDDDAFVAPRKAPPAPSETVHPSYTLEGRRRDGFELMGPRERRLSAAIRFTNGCTLARRARESRAVFSRG